MYLSVQKLRPHAQLPKRATAQSAGYDLYALPESPLTIQPGEICKVPTGIAVAPSRPDVALCIFPRSGSGISAAAAEPETVFYCR